MNDFESELQVLIEKYREFPGTDPVDMARTLIDAGAELRIHIAEPFFNEPKFTGL